jgi:hypothetical protein
MDTLNLLKGMSKYMVPCDSYEEACKLYHDLNDDTIKLITKDTLEYTNLDDHDKIIFSPKIVYGLDSTMKRPIVCFYKEMSITPKAMLQQVCRCRNITRLYYYFCDKGFSPFDMEYDKVMTDMSPLEYFKKECADRSAAADKNFKIHCTPETVAKYIDLYTRIRYDEKCYGTNKYVHFIKTLEARGFVTDPVILPTTKAGRLSKGDLIEIKMAEFDINSDAVRRINDPDMGSKHALMLPPAEILENVTLFVSEPALTKHFSICRYISMDFKKSHEQLDKKAEFNINKLSSESNKTRFLKKMMEACNVGDAAIHVETPPANWKELQEECTSAFRTKSNIDFAIASDCEKCIVRMYKNIYGKDFIETKRTTCKGKTVRKYKVSDEAIKHHLRIMQFRREPTKYTKEKYSGIYEELAPLKEPAVEEEAVAVDEVQQAAVVPPEKRWGEILDSMCSKEKGFDYGGCVLAY